MKQDRSDPQKLIRFGRAVVMHKREKPFVHAFVYKLFCMQLRVDKLDRLERVNTWLFGINRRRPVSFMNADHGDRSGSDLMAWLDKTLETAGTAHPGGATWLQSFPRMFGYVFNPVSFWMMHNPQDELVLVLAEVNNTFGQRHQYVLEAPDQGVIAADTELTCRKVFHVSPFCEIKGHYRFRFQGSVLSPVASEHPTAHPANTAHTAQVKQPTQSSRQMMAIDFFDDDASTQPLLRTAMTVYPQSWTTRRLIAAVARMPFMTLGVMVRIHWHAFKLWRKGAPFFRLPAAPDQEVTRDVR